MSRVTTQYLAKHYLEACVLDVASFKPGNVSFHAAGHGMDAGQFLQSASASVELMTKPGQALGERIFAAVKATRDAVRCNTNLGIILLCAPVIQAVLDYPGKKFDSALETVLSTAGLEDTERVYAAIRVASPGGLGRTETHDVTGPAGAPLMEVMAAAAERDLIARQYANGFQELRGVVLPYLAKAMQRHADEKSVVTDLFLYLLARYQDSHIQRKHGTSQAVTVSRWAEDVHRDYLAATDDGIRHQLLLELDRRLKQQDINPGTTADFCVAGVFIHRLQSQAINNTGVARNYPRTMKPLQADTPQIL